MNKLAILIVIAIAAVGIYAAGNVTGLFVAKAGSDVPVGYEMSTFKIKSGMDLCAPGGKPVIRMYSSATCPHCLWIGDTFDSVAKEYVDAGLIEAHHWEYTVDHVWDDTLTLVLEEKIPSDDINLYYEINPTGSVPTFIFGCKYYRIGTSFESSGGLDAEKTEFKAVINRLIEQSK